MFMRIGFPLSFAVLIVALLFCAFRCLGSDKKIAKSVVLFDIALIPPIIGNLFIIVSTIKTFSLIGCYIYYLGMDLVMFALVGFTTVYCKGIGNGKRRPTILYIMLTADMIQILLNIVFGHAFDLEEIYIQGMPYYIMIPHFGQLIHRVVDYFVFACVILIFIAACIKSARIYRERYSIVLLTMLFIGAWQTFYEVVEKDIDVSVMFDRAHLALSTINDNYKQHIAYYDNKMRDKVLWDQKITIGLSEALRSMQIRPYLQPITNREGKVVGAEALARWIHPVQGFLSPGLFITTLEKNGLIVEVDRHIWRCACQILSKWKEEHKDMFISVNISPKDFYYIDILSEITGLVKEYDIDPKKLRVEITETVMMTDADEKFGKLEELRKAGFIVEMDDFGSGYSWLNLLKDMPVDVLKIDMKFLANSDNIEKAHTIIKNIIKLSEELNIVSLTEGVETVQQYTELSDMGCKLFQGYYFAKPLPQNDYETFAFGEKRISV